ncbi:hypothetical protein [Streptosporangium saharense]|uniref:Regulator of protease activity HflC (Stomatin/prohibitin superfamily) n=1 Tax=Streptosporangium saharense TaxID=1706840 RepID=A0A7W7QWC8_9ACTN|nr:hypothetical protein [Streptosporangium saharense]MBB4920945.1 regulator of protease activity HflC (stomatin/prohibitin superfamily) [Streptosporangium saharense]
MLRAHEGTEFHSDDVPAHKGWPWGENPRVRDAYDAQEQQRRLAATKAEQERRERLQAMEAKEERRRILAEAMEALHGGHQ